MTARTFRGLDFKEAQVSAMASNMGISKEFILKAIQRTSSNSGGVNLALDTIFRFVLCI
jgi:hypothetical protein